MRILVTSSKGGIGKSTVSSGLAVAFAAAGKRVLLVDCDLGGRCLDLMLGEEDHTLFDIGDVASGRATPSDALRKPWGMENLFFCPAPAMFDPSVTEDGKICRALEALASACAAEIVICDTAGMSVAPAIAADFANIALILATQQPASVRAAGTTATALAAAGLRDSRLVINAFDPKAAKCGARSGILDIIDGSGLKLAGLVPYDRALMMAGDAGTTPGKDSAGYLAMANIAGRLMGRETKLLSGVSGISRKHIL